MGWLSPLDFVETQHFHLEKRQKDTGKWFLESQDFQHWLNGTHTTLFSPGIPGAGKTVVAATVVDHLHQSARHDIGVAHLFCEYKAQCDQNSKDFFGALVKQLVQTRLGTPVSVLETYEDHTNGRTRPTLDTLLELLQSICQSYSTVYIVVDALDECSSFVRDLLIVNLRTLQAEADVRLFFTSRFNLEITQQFHADPTVEIRASEGDVKCYILAEMPRLPKCIQQDSELQTTTQTKVVEASDGM